MTLTDAIKEILVTTEFDFGSPENAKYIKDHNPRCAIMSHPDILQMAFDKAFPFVKKETVDFLSPILVKNPYNELLWELDSESWKFTVIYKTLDGKILFDIADEWDECRYLAKHKHKPNSIGGLEIIDIIQRSKSIKLSLNRNHLQRERDLTRLCDDGDKIENYDSSGFKIDGWKTVVSINGVGPHDHLYSIIRKALADHGIIVKERITGYCFPEVKTDPEANPSIVVLHVNSLPMPG